MKTILEERFDTAVKKPQGFKEKFRRSSRHWAVEVLAWLSVRRQRDRKGLNCLMGHYVFDDQISEFREVIKALKNAGEFVNADDAVEMARGKTPTDGRYFHLSFDDGLDCLARNAADILRENDVTPLVFINTGIINNEYGREADEWRRATNYATSLSVMDWNTLRNIGFDIGAHTVSHKNLSVISCTQSLLSYEIGQCKSDIEFNLARECKYFAWPFGGKQHIDAHSVEVLKNFGFHAVFGGFRGTVIPGTTDLFSIPRNQFEVNWPLNHIKYFALRGF